MYKMESSKLIQMFFISILLMCSCELPRYILFVINSDYNSTAAFGSHIIGGIFFFLSLTLVCFAWYEILEVGNVGKKFYSKNGLLVANVLSTCFVLYIFGACITSDSLSSFFHSNIFIAFVYAQIFQTFLYGSSLFFFGLRLLLK